jgi:hypothetical protein
MFTEDIQQLRTVLKTPVVSREIPVVSPGKTWQYFQIFNDRIVEVRCGGQPVLQAERLILEKKQITAITEISQSMSKNFFGKSDSNVFLK